MRFSPMSLKCSKIARFVRSSVHRLTSPHVSPHVPMAIAVIQINHMRHNRARREPTFESAVSSAGRRKVDFGSAAEG
jgi:hypothetical protein